LNPAGTTPGQFGLPITKRIHADPLLLIAYHREGSLDAVALELIGRLGLSLVYTFAQDERVNLPHVSIYSFSLFPTASHHPQGSSPNWEAAAVMATVDIVSRVQS
jgi:hypothetical protein